MLSAEDFGLTVYDCARCGAVVLSGSGAHELCSECSQPAPEPQHEAVRLFTPAPAVMAGQLEL